MRTNQEVSPYINVYHFKDINGNTLMEVKSAKALNPVNGNDEWEEVIVQIKGLPEGTEYFDQVHLMPMGNVKGTKYFENGTLKDFAYVDVAAWAVFENLASAQVFDLKAAAK